MAGFVVQKAAEARLEEIYSYTYRTWGAKKADEYISGLFGRFEQIVKKEVLSHPIPAEFGVNGFYCQYASHFIYWKKLASGQIGIVTLLHQRMHQMQQFQHDIHQH